MSLRIKAKDLLMAYKTSPVLIFPLPLCLVSFCSPCHSVNSSHAGLFHVLQTWPTHSSLRAFELTVPTDSYNPLSSCLRSLIKSCLPSKASIITLFIILSSSLHQSYILFSFFISLHSTYHYLICCIF